MLYFVLYIILIALTLIISIICLFYALSSVIAMFMGAPYVASHQKEIEFILSKLKLKAKDNVIELGSGDGRFLRTAVKMYKVHALGIEIQPWLLYYSRFLAKMQGLRHITFKNQNFYNTDLSQASLIFVFLLPKTLKKLHTKFLKECKKGTIIVSHGFQIRGLEDHLYEKLDRSPYRTYFYKI